MKLLTIFSTTFLFLLTSTSFASFRLARKQPVHKVYCQHSWDLQMPKGFNLGKLTYQIKGENIKISIPYVFRKCNLVKTQNGNVIKWQFVSPVSKKVKSALLVLKEGLFSDKIFPYVYKDSPKGVATYSIPLKKVLSDKKMKRLGQGKTVQLRLSLMNGIYNKRWEEYEYNIYTSGLVHKVKLNLKK